VVLTDAGFNERLVLNNNIESTQTNHSTTH